MPALKEYLDEAGRSPFGEWFAALESAVAARLAAVLIRLEQGHKANVKGVGAGVLEYRLDSGPGYRVYFGRDGEAWVILLAGGTKRRQQKDIEEAQWRWADYKRRKPKTR